MSNQTGGIAQSKDLLKQSVTGTSAALPLKCHNSGVTDRKKKGKKWILNQDKSTATRKEQNCKKPEGRQGQMEPEALYSHEPLQRGTRALVAESTLVVRHCLLLLQGPQLHPGVVPSGTGGNLD